MNTRGIILQVVLAVFVLLASFQCGVKKRPDQMSVEDVRKAISAYFAAVRAMDVEAWVATFAENGVSYDPVGAPPYKGHEALRQFFQGINETFEKLVLTEDHVFVAGNGAAVKWTCHGVGKNGRHVTFEGIDVFEVNEEGKIQTVWAYWDPASMVAKLRK